MSFIPYGRQDISERDIQAVVGVLRSDFLTQGPAVPAFERAVATYCGVEYAIAVNSATSALHIACLALGVSPGDRVWTSPITFVASANCARFCGADVDFVDVDPRTSNMCVSALTEKLREAELRGTLPKVVIPVHFSGQSCEMAEIQALGTRYGFKIIEDASHAIGGRYKSEPVGNCRHSDIAVFSFHPVKIITTGEGGMATTNSPELARRLARLRSHGITRETSELTRADEGAWYYEQNDLGFNYRMTDLQAALGTSQMHRMDEFVACRTARAAEYDRLLEGLPVRLPWRHPDNASAFHLYVVRVEGGAPSRRVIFDRMREEDVGVNVHYIPVYLQPYYAALGFRAGHCPEAERHYAQAISLPLFATFTQEQQARVVSVLARAVV